MFDKQKELLKNTLKMYDETLEDMKERNAKMDTVSFVIEMRRQVEEQLKALEGGNSILLISSQKDYAPYTCNRFVLDFGVDEIKDYYVEQVSYYSFLTVIFRNSEEFFAPEYFEKNKQFDEVKLYLLNPYGEKVAVIEFKDVELENVSMDEFNYKKDDVLRTFTNFTFKSITHKTL
jgi:hypothetical protein